eukprot:CAMPEP_0115047494 /NCGR_PEP_ID=MMETSP0216-20121206/49333_1 /TAXON_ID=223996 /ORGANISM="Protocruzia adherens, Strain Boccale" /LENGTH=513 /DNA_ID=CAMNT_0002430687 /DNA_START=69 /DNA_END=1610 /DNA_ORIENTATION=-
MFNPQLYERRENIKKQKEIQSRPYKALDKVWKRKRDQLGVNAEGRMRRWLEEIDPQEIDRIIERGIHTPAQKDRDSRSYIHHTDSDIPSWNGKFDTQRSKLSSKRGTSLSSPTNKFSSPDNRDPYTDPKLLKQDLSLRARDRSKEIHPRMKYHNTNNERKRISDNIRMHDMINFDHFERQRILNHKFRNTNRHKWVAPNDKFNPIMRKLSNPHAAAWHVDLSRSRSVEPYMGDLNRERHKDRELSPQGFKSQFPHSKAARQLKRSCSNHAFTYQQYVNSQGGVSLRTLNKSPKCGRDGQDSDGVVSVGTNRRGAGVQSPRRLPTMSPHHHHHHEDASIKFYKLSFIQRKLIDGGVEGVNSPKTWRRLKPLEKGNYGGSFQIPKINLSREDSSTSTCLSQVTMINNSDLGEFATQNTLFSSSSPTNISMKSFDVLGSPDFGPVSTITKSGKEAKLKLNSKNLKGFDSFKSLESEGASGLTGRPSLIPERDDEGGMTREGFLKPHHNSGHHREAL